MSKPRVDGLCGASNSFRRIKMFPTNGNPIIVHNPVARNKAPLHEQGARTVEVKNLGEITYTYCEDEQCRMCSGLLRAEQFKK